MSEAKDEAKDSSVTRAADFEQTAPAEVAGLALTKDEWLDRCAKRYVERGGIPAADARGFAETCWEVEEGSFEQSPLATDPEEAADCDMDEWTDDEGDAP